MRLAAEGGVSGAVLDAGCRTGEKAVHLASLGLPVLGVDVAGTALMIAREKARGRGVDVELADADAFALHRLGRRSATVLESGLFHTFDRDERPWYVAGLYVLCFRDDGPDTGPHPVGQEELRAAFTAGTGWDVVAVEADRIRTRFPGDDGAPAGGDGSMAEAPPHGRGTCTRCAAGGTCPAHAGDAAPQVRHRDAEARRRVQ